MLNDEYEPKGEGEERILEYLESSGRVRPMHLYADLDVSAGSAQHWLERLLAAGWIARPKEGIYEIVADPRELTDEELAQTCIERAVDLVGYEKVKQLVDEMKSE